jgi:hypothetical protein
MTFLMDSRKRTTRLLLAVWPWLVTNARVGTDVDTFLLFHVGNA